MISTAPKVNVDSADAGSPIKLAPHLPETLAAAGKDNTEVIGRDIVSEVVPRVVLMHVVVRQHREMTRIAFRVIVGFVRTT